MGYPGKIPASPATSRRTRQTLTRSCQDTPPTSGNRSAGFTQGYGDLAQRLEFAVPARVLGVLKFISRSVSIQCQDLARAERACPLLNLPRQARRDRRTLRCNRVAGPLKNFQKT